MEKNRNIKNSENSKSNFRKRYLKTIAITDIFILIVFIICYGPFSPIQKTSADNIYYFKIISGFIFFIALINLLLFLKTKDDIKCENSINFVDTFLSAKEYTEVIPKKSLYYDHYSIHLEGISKFYAIISEKDNMVIINAHYKNEGNFKFFESFPKEMFTKLYDLKK